MNKQNERELLLWNADVLSTGIRMPFDLPEAYFDQLPAALISRIRVATLPDPAVQHLPKDTVFHIPDHYFEHLTGIVLEKVKAANKIILHQETPWPAQKQFSYSLPPEYFEQLPDIIMQHIRTDNLSVDEELRQNVSFLQDLRVAFPMEAPEGYFETLPDQVMEHIHNHIGQEEPELSPLLTGLKNKLPFTVPEEYFNQPERTIPAEELHHRQKKNRTGWAIAAGVALLVTLTGWLFFNRQEVSGEQQTIAASGIPVGTNDLNRQLAQVSNEDIQLYIENHIDEFDENSLANAFLQKGTSYNWKDALQGVSNQEIEDYLEGNL